jgi:hypothetical protein
VKRKKKNLKNLKNGLAFDDLMDSIRQADEI